MNRRGALLFAAMCVIWGVPYLMIRVAVRELAPVTLVFGRTVVAALLLTPVALYRGDLRPLLRCWPALLAYTAVEVAIPWVLLARAETKLTSSLTGLLIAAVPLVGAVVVTLTGERDRLGRRSWLGLLVGIVGVAAIVGLDIGQVNVPALVEVGCVAVAYAVGPIILARRLGDVPALGVVAASLAISALVYAPFAASRWPSSRPSAHVLESVAGLAVVCTALAFLRVLRADLGGRARPGDRDHLRQPGGRGDPRRRRARGAHHPRHGDRVRARARGLRARDGARPRAGR